MIERHAQSGVGDWVRQCLLGCVLGFLVPISAAAKIADTSSVEAALALVDAFDAVCAAQVEQEELSDKSHLITLSDDQIAGLSAVLGYNEAPEAIWSQQDATWYQVQKSLAAPATCLFISFGITLDDMQAAWAQRYAELRGWQSFSQPDIRKPDPTNESSPTYLSGAYAFRSFEGRVIMAAVAGMQMQDTGVVMLRYQKTAGTPDDCDTANGECP